MCLRTAIFNRENLEKLNSAVGREHIVLDLSCRKRDGAYYVVTDRWQKFTDMKLTEDVLTELAGSCDEFLIHGVDVEGRRSGMEEELVRMLGGMARDCRSHMPAVSASLEDLERLQRTERRKRGLHRRERPGSVRREICHTRK